LNFAQRRPWFFLLSALVILPGVICLILSPGLKPGIDFTGGSSLTVQFPEGSKANQESIRLELSETGYNDAKIQNIGKVTSDGERYETFLHMVGISQCP
jgi:preprotein translocase subunit SecF